MRGIHVSTDEFDSFRSSGILAGVPVIRGTKVPLAVFLEHLRSGKSIDQFLQDHPAVTEAQVSQTLVGAIEALIESRYQAVHLPPPHRAG